AIRKAIGRYDLFESVRPSGCTFRTFLKRVLTDRFKDFVKHLRRARRRHGLVADSAFPNDTGGRKSPRAEDAPDRRPASNPAAAAECNELLRRLRDAAADLGDMDRDLLENFLGGVRLRVIAQRLELSYDAAKHRWHALRRRLARDLRACGAAAE